MEPEEVVAEVVSTTEEVVAGATIETSPMLVLRSWSPEASI